MCILNKNYNHKFTEEKVPWGAPEETVWGRGKEERIDRAAAKGEVIK